MADKHSHAALALENARLDQESRRAVRDRDDMLAIVSHDLRNRVNAIVMLTGEVLSREPGDERPLMERDDVEAIRGAARQADGLIQDLQDVSRIASSRLWVERQPVLLSDLVKELADMFEPVMKDAVLRFVRRIDEQLPPVQADRHRLAQVLSNLLGNAVRFTPHGGEIVLTAERHEDSVRIGVRDTGPGVSPGDVPRLFERHWQRRACFARGRDSGCSSRRASSTRTAARLASTVSWARAASSGSRCRGSTLPQKKQHRGPEGPRCCFVWASAEAA